MQPWDAAEGPMRAIIALGGLAGIRLGELVRMTWEDVWMTEGHITISGSKAKTRERRLIVICPALAQWLAPFRSATGKIWEQSIGMFHAGFYSLLDGVNEGRETAIPRRRNGLRHAFCTFHLALHSNEGLTAAMAGNSPAMLHQHYKALATKPEAEAWFNTLPAPAANAASLDLAPKG